MPEDQLQTLNRSRPGLSTVAAVLANKLIQLKVLLTSDLDFLTYCFHEGCEYNTIAGFRSGISAILDWGVCGRATPTNICTFEYLPEIFNKKSPHPKVSFIWDARNVFVFLISKDCSNRCSLKDLTLKLIMLSALKSAARASEICFLDINYLVRHSSRYSPSARSLTLRGQFLFLKQKWFATLTEFILSTFSLLVARI